MKYDSSPVHANFNYTYPIHIQLNMSMMSPVLKVGDIKALILFSWIFLLSIITNSQWTDGKCGQCKCYSKIGRYGSREHIANCSQRDIISVPDSNIVLTP
jgi:hypothetical protein